MGLWAIQKMELSHLAEGGAEQPELSLWNNSAALWQNDNISDHLVQTNSEIPQVPITTCPVHRTNQIVLRSQPSGETTSVLPLITDGPSYPGKQEKNQKKPSQLLPKLSNKRGSTLPP
jgi:hypothetical protein